RPIHWRRWHDGHCGNPSGASGPAHRPAAAAAASVAGGRLGPAGARRAGDRLPGGGQGRQRVCADLLQGHGRRAVDQSRRRDHLSHRHAAGLWRRPRAVAELRGIARRSLREGRAARHPPRGAAHLHRLSLRFHLERQTGGLSRVIERGTTGIEYFLFFVLFNVVPTLLEIALVCGILWGFYNFWFALVTLVTIVGYVWYTLTITEWRLKYRRRMNEA